MAKRSPLSGPLGEYVLGKVPIVGKQATINQVRRLLEKERTTYDTVDYIYVVDEGKRLIGVFSVRALFNAKKATHIKHLMQTKLVKVTPRTSLERVAHLALTHNLKSLPVVRAGRLLGVVPARTILATLNQALREDIFHFAGIHRSHTEFENSLKVPLLKAVKDRLLWLIIGLFGAMLIAVYMDMFESTLAGYYLVASFVPAIVYCSDALGTQLQTLFVRDLAVLGQKLDLKVYFLRQLGLSVVIAGIISGLMFGFIALFWQAAYLAFLISFAGFLSLLTTSLSSLFITLLIRRFKFDPGLGSGPIATVISDMTSVVIYFLIIVWFL